MPQRTMPVRDDGWQPTDRIYDGILDRCVADAEAQEGGDGTPEIMAAVLVVAVLGVVIVSAAKSVTGALVVCGLIAAGVFLFMISSRRPEDGDRSLALRGIGGPGRLPAGYLVHPGAWRAGMATHVKHLPESQLRAAADLCHLYPGTVDDLILFVGNIAIHVPPPRHPATPADVQKRAREMARVGLLMLREHLKGQAARAA